jgi:hypothetical protein
LAYWRRGTSFYRLLPTFLIIGAQRCGSTSLYRHLLSHPAVGGYSRKEVFYFDLRHDRGLAWYRGHFPLASFRRQTKRQFGVEPAIGEASINYMFWPGVAGRVLALNPEMKLIALLRDPAARAHSGYHLQKSQGWETLPFEEALAKEPERLAGEVDRVLADPSYKGFNLHHFSYLARGRYFEQLERWFQLFPQEQILILRAEDLFDQPSETLDAVLEFLGLPPWPMPDFPRENSRRYAPMRRATREYLVSYFSDHNRRLHEFLGRDFGWPTRSLAPEHQGL